MSRSWTTFVKKNSWNSLQNKPAILSDNQISFSEIINKPTTLSGYGITDAQPLGNELTAIQALADTVGFLRKTGNGSYEIDIKSYLPSIGGVIAENTNISLKPNSRLTVNGGLIDIDFGDSPALRFWNGTTLIGGVGTARWALSGGGNSNIALIAVGTNAIVFGTNDTERMRIDGNGQVTLESLRVTSRLTIFSSTATGNTGSICWDSNYIYVCTATNTWKRASLSSW